MITITLTSNKKNPRTTNIMHTHTYVKCTAYQTIRSNSNMHATYMCMQEEKYIFHGNYFVFLYIFSSTLNNTTSQMSITTKQHEKSKCQEKRRDKKVLNKKKKRNKNISGARNQDKHKNMHLYLHLMCCCIYNGHIAEDF
ncbi:hypothetical protein DOY81_005359 [Sarcophaga bullata]|nr:hypothetical protein DOY81_005359 [Sarcophaga bullata]